MSDKLAQRMERFRNAGLYLVTSEELSGGRGSEEIVRQALAAGVRLIQLREKGKTKPREAQLKKWLAVKGIGKRKAWKMLGFA